MRKKELSPSATARTDLGIIMLSDRSQSEKDKYPMLSLIWRSNEQNKLANKIEPEAWTHETD